MPRRCDGGRSRWSRAAVCPHSRSAIAFTFTVSMSSNPQRRGNAKCAAAVFVSLRTSTRMSVAAGRAWQAVRKSDCPSRGINPPAVASAIVRSGTGRMSRLRSLPFESD